LEQGGLSNARVNALKKALKKRDAPIVALQRANFLCRLWQYGSLLIVARKGR
jgi:hypothetical protein